MADDVKQGAQKADKAAAWLPPVGDIRSTAEALQVKRKLMNAGRPMEAQKWMRRWKQRQQKQE